MKLAVVLIATGTLAMPASAHRLDEYLQAARVSVAAHRIVLDLDLTPGVAILPEVVGSIDSDGDGRVSGKEGKAYALRVLNEMRVEIDGKHRSLKLLDATFPPRAELEAGVGIILLTASVKVATLVPGLHEIGIRNNHLPRISVYLVNALNPVDKTIRIDRQVRDQVQREYHLFFEVKGPLNGR